MAAESPRRPSNIPENPHNARPILAPEQCLAADRAGSEIRGQVEIEGWRFRAFAEGVRGAWLVEDSGAA
jgi:hypothetical protein